MTPTLKAAQTIAPLAKRDKNAWAESEAKKVQEKVAADRVLGSNTSLSWRGGFADLGGRGRACQREKNKG